MVQQLYSEKHTDENTMCLCNYAPPIARVTRMKHSGIRDVCRPISPRILLRFIRAAGE